MHKDGHDTGSLLAQDYELLQSLGPDYTSYKEQVSGLISRLESGRFHLAILGQFKRGKSTFLNALLGDAVLPSSVIPLTAVPTLITYNQEKTSE
jgi:Dynamin family.